MTTTPIITGSSSSASHRSSRSHRIDVHRHADQTLAEIEARNALLAARTPKKTSLFISYLTNFARGLEGMFQAIHVRP